MSETMVKQQTRDPLGALRRERERFVALAFWSADIVMELDSQGEIVFATGSTEALLGTGQNELVGRRSLEIGDFAAPRGGGLGQKPSGVG